MNTFFSVQQILFSFTGRDTSTHKCLGIDGKSFRSVAGDFCKVMTSGKVGHPGIICFPSCIALSGKGRCTEPDETRPQCKLAQMLNMSTLSRYAYHVKKKKEDRLRPEKKIAFRSVRHGAEHTRTHTLTSARASFKPVKIKTMNTDDKQRHRRQEFVVFFLHFNISCWNCIIFLIFKGFKNE